MASLRRTYGEWLARHETAGGSSLSLARPHPDKGETVLAVLSHRGL